MKTGSQLARLAEFDKAVRAGGYPSAHSFSTDYEVSVRTVKRDIAFLRDRLLAPLVFDKERGGYRYTEEWFFGFGELPQLPDEKNRKDLEAVLDAERILQEAHRADLAAALQRLRQQFLHVSTAGTPVAA